MEQATATAVLQLLSGMQLPEHFLGQPSLANISVTSFASKSALKPTWQSLKHFSRQASVVSISLKKHLQSMVI